jgi:hypothetical protein
MVRRHFLIAAALAGSAFTAISPSSSHAQGTPVKIGLVAALSGQSATLCCKL